jgi:hypothetical protein
MSIANDPGNANMHLGELAELYALGALETAEGAAVEAHVAACAACAAALGAAEQTVAALEDAFVPSLAPPDRLAARIAASAATVVPLVPRRAAPRVRARTPLFATAAALLLTVGLAGGALLERSADVREAARESAILATIASSHFNHVTLTPQDPAAPVSKVLYARNGAWMYLIVDSASCDCRVAVHSAAGIQDAGQLDVRGSTATLFVRDLSRPEAVELRDASGRVLASAKLVYSAR